MSDPLALDPFSTIVILSILSYQPDGVKIAIDNNTIILYEPIFRDWLVRHVRSWFSPGFSKDCLYRLKTPVERALRWYRSSTPLLFELAIKGLDKLCLNYDNQNCGNAIQTIKFIKKLIKSPELVDESNEEIEKENLLKLKDSWSADEIKTINSLFNLISSEKDKSYIIKSILDFVRGKEPNLLKIIQKPSV